MLKPYEPGAYCPKCRFIEVSTIYTPAGAFPANDFRFDIPECQNEEHFLRRCRRCGYSWVESTLYSAMKPSGGNTFQINVGGVPMTVTITS